MAEPVLTLEGIRKVYNPGTAVATEVLHGIDFSLAAGEFCAIIGPSGSGKSTLLNIIGLLDRPTDGRLLIGARDTAQLSDKMLTALRGEAIGFVFQYHYLITAFTALENVMMPLLVGRGFPNPEMARTAERLLDEVGLLPWRDAKVGNLSGGQQQRVAVARALARRPSIVLADEPTGNLDTKSADAVFELMREVNRRDGTSFLIVTHNLRLADRCDRVVEVVDGRIVSDRKAAAGPIPA
ncbi:MAG TPA: ABC transporter ATP-binding protein [Dongiaceae bacterium]|nr:ABC transporter ATP-binding protein [Dongiaceae bacterium]